MPKKFPTEWTFLDGIQKIIQRPDSRIHIGWGDDAFSFQSLPGYSLICQDMMVEGVHFELGLSSAADIGYKALACCLSDLAAMAAHPQFVHVSLALPTKITKSWLDDFYKSMCALADATGCQIVGGDLTTHPETLVIDINVYGSSLEKPIRIGSARPGDYLLSSGPLGLSSVGLWALKNNQKEFSKSINQHLRPRPRLDLVEELQFKRQYIEGLTDCSDGLLQDIYSFSDLTEIGCHLLGDQINVHEEIKKYATLKNLNPLDVVFAGGEDYELLLLVREGDQTHFPSFQPVARFTDSSSLKVIENGQEKEPNYDISWTHF